MPSLDAFQKRLAPSGVVVLGVSVDTSEPQYREFLAEGEGFFSDGARSAGHYQCGVRHLKFPETYVIDSHGTVLQKHIGARLWSEEKLIQEIQALL